MKIPFDKSMLLPKLFYFCFFSAAASLVPFLALFYQEIGLSGRQFGLLTAIPPLVSLVSAPLWGGIADATRQHKRLLLVAILGSFLSVVLLSLIPNSFWLVAVLLTYAFFSAPVVPIVDNSVMNLLKGRKSEYGKQRLWGAIGWGLAAPVIGILIDIAGLSWIFYGYLFFMMCLFLITVKLTIVPSSFGTIFRDGFQKLITSGGYMIFLGIVFIGGLSISLTTYYLFLLMKELGSSTTLMGLALTIATISELPVLFFSGKMISRWRSKGLLFLGLFSNFTRAMALSFVWLPWMVLPIQLLHGLSFSTMWVAGVSYADQIAPPGIGATSQGIFTGVMFGLGSAIGAIAGGIVYEIAGAQMMFRWLGITVLLFTLVFLAASKKYVGVSYSPSA